MLNNLRHEYKGYSIELTPRQEYCSSFAAEVRDPDGKVVSMLKTAGDTEKRAVDRGRELVDFDLAYKSRES